MVRARLYLKGKLHHATWRSSVLLAHIGLTNLPFPIEQFAVRANHVIMKTIILRLYRPTCTLNARSFSGSYVQKTAYRMERAVIR